MKIKYVGGRTWLKVSLNRRAYYFTKENDRTLDIKEQEVIDCIFSLPNRQEFRVVIEEQKQDEVEQKSEESDKQKISFKNKLGRPKGWRKQNG